jgi:hypothetical protein
MFPSLRKSGDVSQELVGCPKSRGLAAVIEADDHVAGLPVRRQVVGERADRLTHSILRRRREALLSLHAVAFQIGC